MLESAMRKSDRFSEISRFFFSKNDRLFLTKMTVNQKWPLYSRSNDRYYSYFYNGHFDITEMVRYSERATTCCRTDGPLEPVF